MGSWLRPTPQGSPGRADPNKLQNPPSAPLVPAAPPNQYDLNTLPEEGQNYGGAPYQAPEPYNPAPIDPNNRSAVIDPNTGQLVNTYGAFEPDSFMVQNPWGDPADPLSGLVQGRDSGGTMEARMQPGPGWVKGFNEAGQFDEWQEDPDWDSSGWMQAADGTWYQTRDPNAPQATGVAGPPATGGSSDFGGDEGQDRYGDYGDFLDKPLRQAEVFENTDWTQAPFISEYGKPKLDELDEQTNLERMLPGFEEQMPDFANDPGLAPYYEDAKRRVQESVDAWGASAGRYGTSAALEIGADEMARLEGERALNEANYALDRSAEQRGWVSDLTTAGGEADAGRQDRWEAQTDLAGDIGGAEWDQKLDHMAAAANVDAGELGKFVADMTVAIGVENLSNAEKTLVLDAIWGPMQTLMQISNQTYDQTITGEDEALQADIAFQMTEKLTELGLDREQADGVMQAINGFVSGYAAFK